MAWDDRKIKHKYFSHDEYIDKLQYGVDGIGKTISTIKKCFYGIKGGVESLERSLQQDEDVKFFNLYYISELLGETSRTSYGLDGFMQEFETFCKVVNNFTPIFDELGYVLASEEKNIKGDQLFIESIFTHDDMKERILNAVSDFNNTLNNFISGYPDIEDYIQEALNDGFSESTLSILRSYLSIMFKHIDVLIELHEKLRNSLRFYMPKDSNRCVYIQKEPDYYDPYEDDEEEDERDKGYL